MTTTTFDIKTDDGFVDTHLFMPGGEGPHPAVIFYMDGIGIRQSLFDMAERLTASRYAVLLPNLYYRHGPAEPLSFETDRDRIMTMLQSVTNESTMRDTKHYLAYLDAEPDVFAERVGCVGYCMGGAPSLTAAGTFPERVAAAASFHGGRLATDKPDSPHLLASKMKGEIYVGVPEIDPHLTPGETDRLETALKEGGANYTLEIYPGAQHGFAVPGHPVYDQASSERHWERLLALFKRNLHT